MCQCEQRYPYDTAVRQALEFLRERQHKLRVQAEERDDMGLRGEEGSTELWAHVEELATSLSMLEAAQETDYLLLNLPGPQRGRAT